MAGLAGLHCLQCCLPETCYLHLWPGSLRSINYAAEQTAVSSIAGRIRLQSL
jgi:hypothetical protein